MPIQPLTSLETEHTRFLYESAYTPLSQQPYLLSTPFMEGDTYPIGSVFFLVFDSPSSDIQAEFASGVRRSLTFRMADGIAVTAPVSCVSYLFGQTLYVAFTLLSTIFLLPTPHLQQGASSMVFLPRDGSDAPVESVYADNGVGQVPLAGGTPHATTDGKVVAPAKVEVTNFPSNGSAVTAVDGGLASVGNTADAAYVSGAGTMIALLKAIFLKVAGTLGVSVTNWPSSQAVTGSVTVSNLPSTQATSVADGQNVTIGTTTDTASANTLVGLLKALKSLLTGTLTTSVSNFPSSQTVAGSVSVSNLPATQPVSGSVSVSNLPASQAITSLDGAQATIGTTTDTTSANTLVGLLKAIKSALLGTLGVSGSVSVTNLPSTQATSMADGGSVTAGAKADSAYSDTSGAASGSFIALLKGLFVKVSGHALETGGNLAQVASNTANVANESGGHLANMDVTLGGQSDTAAASSSVAGSMMAFLKAILAAVISPVAPSYEYNSGVTGTVDRVRNAQGKGYATAAIAASGATVGQPVITLASSAPATLQVGMQIQLLGGTEEPADIVSIAGTAVTLSANIVNASHTSIGWDTFAVNGPLAGLFSAIGVSLRGLVLYNPNGSVATPYQQAQSDGNGALKMASSDGAQITQGSKADATTNDTTSAWSMISLLKGIYARLTTGIAVSNFPSSQTVAGTVSISNFPATQPESIVDGSDATQGAKADSAATDSTSSWSIVALLKGMYAKLAGTLTTSVSNFPATQATSVADGGNVTIGTTTDAASALTLVGLLKAIKAAITSAMSFIQPDVTTTGTITAAQPLIGTTVANGSVTLAIGNGQSSWKAQLTGLTATDVIAIDHSSDGGTTWNSSNFIVAGAANNTPVSSVTAISGQVELSGNDSSVSHIKVRCSTYNTGDTIGVTIRAGFGIGRVGIITPIPAGSNSIGSVNVGTMPSLPAGTNQIGHVVLDSGTVSGIEYQWNGGAPNNQNYDRLRTVQALTPTTATISSGNGAASTAPVLSTATGLQPGQWVLLSNSTPASDATAEWVLTTASYVAGTTTLALTSGIVTAGHTNAYWNAYTVFGPQASFFYWEGLSAQGLALNNGAQAILAQGDKFGNLKTSGGFLELTGLSAAASNADLIPSTDVSSFKWWSIQITGVWAGTMTVQGSNDNVNWNAVLLQNSAANPTNSTVISSGSTGIFYGACLFRYLRLRMTSYSSGTANGVAELYSSPAPLIVLGVTQNGTFTVQPGNTANTTPWLVNTADGGQPTIGAKADAAYTDVTGATAGSLVSLLKGLLQGHGTTGDGAASSGTGGTWSLASLLRGILNGIQGTLTTKGGFTELTGLSANALNADLLPSTDVSAYKWWSIQVLGVWAGTFTVQGSNDNANWNATIYQNSGANPTNSTQIASGSTGIFYGACSFRYLRIRMTSYTSGPATGVAELYTSAPPMIVIGTTQNGTFTVQPGNTPNTTAWLVDASDRAARLLGKVGIQVGGADVGAGNAVPMSSADGGQVTIGTKADTATNDTTSAWSVVALLKGIYAKLAGTVAVSGTFWQTTQPISAASASFVDGAIVTNGTLSDTAASSGTGGSWTLAALLRGILNGIQGVQKFKGDFLEPTTFAVSTAAADLLPSTDVSAYKWVSVQLVAGTSPAWQGAVSFQGSNDNSNWQNVILGKVDSASQNTSVTSLVGSIIYSGAIVYRYFRVRLTTATQGSISGTVELYTSPVTPMGVTTNSSQNGTYTVQPGNTPNTTPWLASIHDGTNKANVFANGQANQNAALVAGAFTEQTGLSAGSLNANLVPPTEVSAYKWWSLQVTALASGGAIAFQGSNDNTNWQSVEAYITSSAAVFSTGASQVGIFYGACNFRYFRVVQTGWTSGATTGVLELYTNAGAFTTSPSLGSSNSTIGGVFTKQGTVNTAIPVGTATNTVVKAANGYLARILITAVAGTPVQVNIYDNSTTNTGTIIGIVKSTVAIGDIVDVQMVGNAGITVGGATGNPAMTILYS